MRVEKTAVLFSKQSGTARQKASLSLDRGVFLYGLTIDRDKGSGERGESCVL
ncbi:hypothetical protein CHCC14820_0953 [Bacillus paralicheniformis]|uniref:Uncharacterized protein n=2 Tax=Bacillus subtilis group TaxID=653685 RepID=A0A6N2F2C6_9BACI|nr:hypothetical protein SC10_B2orf00135 [Bacillus paralicheniformis]OLF98176.1 hypothetical protein B4121_0482 [Bacillus paralicheniformis]OLG02848.1 hypothetical protein B4125_3727 [Bacillus paralicheniformis]TWJ46336.1 hypothetical protein CHCC5027_4133 [Bacillus paralicheniformis]TWJ54156.1 hypothetical protein CHCC5023_3706 [Bacillus paralicheniformis]